MRSRSRFLRSSPAPALMLTSLLDMFTIILIFLLVSFEAESYEFRLQPDVKLPESSTRTELQAAVNIAVSASRIAVAEEDVVQLRDGTAQPNDYDAGKIQALVDQLKVEYEQRFGEDPKIPVEEGAEPIVVIQSDKSLDYRTLYLVLRSAAHAGFFKYRLAAMKS